MTLEIKTERRGLTFSPGSGEPAISHEEAINTLNAFLRAEQIAEMAKVACTSCDYDNNGSCDLLVTPGQCSRARCIAEAFYNADYRKPVDGEWRDRDRNGVSIKGYMVCPACDVMIPTCDEGRYCLSRLHYCPNCGAKMKGGAE